MILLALKIGSALYVANHIFNSLYPQESEGVKGQSEPLCEECRTTTEPTKQPIEQKGVDTVSRPVVRQRGGIVGVPVLRQRGVPLTNQS